MTTPAPRIMAVFSEPIISDTLAIILKQFGYECVVAYRGQQAIDKAREFHPQFVLMEVVMPGMFGTDAAKIILDEQPECKIVLASGSILKQHDEEMRKELQLQIVAWPIKPLDLIDLIARYGFPPPTTPKLKNSDKLT